jgi:hypothetical protein
MLRAGQTIDHPDPGGLLEALRRDLLCLQREDLDEVHTRCRPATHHAADVVAIAATNLQTALNELVVNAPRSGGSTFVRTRPIADHYIDTIDAQAAGLSNANSAFIQAARKDLR